MRKAFKILKLNANVFFSLPQPLCKGTSENRLWVSSSKAKREFRLCASLYPCYCLFELDSTLLSRHRPHVGQRFCFCFSFSFISLLCACSRASATAVQPGLIKPDKQSWPQRIASAPDGLHTFKYDGKWCRFDFNCLCPARVTGTDTPLVHFCNSVLFPGWC